MDSIINFFQRSEDIEYLQNYNGPRRSDFSWTLYIFSIISAFFLYHFRLFFSEKIIKPLIKKYYSKKKEISKQKLKHSVDNIWYSIFYLFVSSFGLILLFKADWIYNVDNIFKNYHNNNDMENIFWNIYWIIQGGFYIQALYCVIFVDEELSDYWVYIIHHICTILVHGVNLSVAGMRMGSSVQVLHDIVDIFLYISKTLNQLKVPDFIMTPVFIIFTLSYLLLRLTYLPFLIYNIFKNKYAGEALSTRYLFHYFENTTKPFELNSFGFCINGYCLGLYYFGGLLLCVLVCLHAYWFYLILRILKKAIFSSKKQGKISDIREKEE